MDLPTVIRYAQIVEKTYGVPPSSLENAAGQAFTVAWGSSPAVEYAVITTIYANDPTPTIWPPISVPNVASSASQSEWCCRILPAGRP